MCIVGGGASGLVTAMELVKNNADIYDDVIVLETNDRVLKKLLATGNGQANLSNAKISKDNYYGDTDFISDFFENAKNLDVEKYFSDLGLPFTTLSDGRKYPLSRQANAVVDFIRFYLEKAGVIIKTGEKVEKITSLNDGFLVKSTNLTVNSKVVVLSTGGKAGPQYGTDGSSYSLALPFNHKTTKLYPALVQVKTDTSFTKGLKGLKEYAKVSAFDGKTLLKTAVGDVLFTDYGVSGSAVFQVSGHLAMAKEPSINVEFLPDYSESEIENIILKRQKTVDFLDKTDLLLGILNKKIGQAVVKTASKLDAKTVAHAVKNFSLKVKGTLDFNYAQVTKGGIDTKFINPITLESKLQKGLYFTGEIMNVDGDCGGYNLDFAFKSSIVCATAIKKYLISK